MSDGKEFHITKSTRTKGKVVAWNWLADERMDLAGLWYCKIYVFQLCWIMSILHLYRLPTITSYIHCWMQSSTGRQPSARSLSERDVSVTTTSTSLTRWTLSLNIQSGPKSDTPVSILR